MLQPFQEIQFFSSLCSENFACQSPTLACLLVSIRPAVGGEGPKERALAWNATIIKNDPGNRISDYLLVKSSLFVIFFAQAGHDQSQLFGCHSWLPDWNSQFLYCRCFALLAWRTMAPLRCAAKFDPFLSLDCAPMPSTLAQSKERKGSKFTIWQHCL